MTKHTAEFNAALLVVVAICLLALGRKITVGRAAIAWATIVVATAGLAVWAGADGFDTVRLLGWTTFLHGPLSLAGFALLFHAASRRRAAVACLTLSALLLGASAYAYRVEPTWLEVTRVTLRSQEVSERVRIALVADVQTDRVGGYERRAMRTLMRERPDLITFAGDYIQAPLGHDVPQAEHLRRILLEEGVRAPLGVVAVRGNVDDPPWATAFDGLGYAVSQKRQTVRAGPVTVTALSEHDSFDPRLVIPDQPGLHVVVGHSPDYALGRIEADLLLAGHTHGGQFRLPLLGPVVNNTMLPRAAADGVSRLSGGRTLVISRGVGMERGPAPRLRFLCRPQIVLVDVLPAVG